MKKIKFNILDAFIIVVVLGIAAAVCFKFLQKTPITQSNTFKSMEYTLKVESIRDFSVDAIPVDAPLCVEETGEFIGTIVSKETKPATSELLMADGTTKRVTVPNRYDAYLKVLAQGVQQPNGFFVNGNLAMNIGDTIACRVGTVVILARVHAMFDGSEQSESAEKDQHAYYLKAADIPQSTLNLLVQNAKVTVGEDKKLAGTVSDYKIISKAEEAYNVDITLYIEGVVENGVITTSDGLTIIPGSVETYAIGNTEFAGEVLP